MCGDLTARNTSSSVSSSPTYTTVAAPILGPELLHGLRLGRRAHGRLDHEVPAAHPHALHALELLFEALGGQRPSRGASGLAVVEGDPGRFVLHPRAVHGARRPLAQRANRLQVLALLGGQHDVVGGRVLEAVAADQAQTFGPVELGAEVGQTPAGHDGHGHAVVQQAVDGLPRAGQQRGLVGAGHERRERAVHVGGNEYGVGRLCQRGGRRVEP